MGFGEDFSDCGWNANCVSLGLSDGDGITIISLPSKKFQEIDGQDEGNH